MALVRPSVLEDIPAQRALWALAFGDGGAYIDNFYNTYYRPDRVLVLEEGGAVRAMTAWFDTAFAVPGRGNFRAAYLYAVATHPDFRGRGLAGALLAGADEYFRALSIPAVTTVPAEESLHRFFGRNGFGECFTQNVCRRGELTAPESTPPFALERLTPAVYARERERLLAGAAHIALPVEAIAYQGGCCALTTGGGLYRAGDALFCAEGMEDGRLLVKELLGDEGARQEVLKWLPALLPGWSGDWRGPGQGEKFGMLKWLDGRPWDWSATAYLGLAFD